MFSLHDDGTMDTLLVCDECGQTYRFTYPGGSYPYDVYVQDTIEELEEEHECKSPYYIAVYFHDPDILPELIEYLKQSPLPIDFDQEPTEVP